MMHPVMGHVTYLQIIIFLFFFYTVTIIFLFRLLEPLDERLCLGMDLLTQLSAHVLLANFPGPLQKNLLLQNISIIEHL